MKPNEGQHDSGVQPSTSVHEATASDECESPKIRRSKRRRKSSALVQSSSSNFTDEWELADDIEWIARWDEHGRERYHVCRSTGTIRQYRAEQVAELMGTDSLKWCAARPHMRLTAEIAFRWGLMTDEACDLEWHVDEIMYVQGERVVRRPCGKVVLYDGTYVARNRDDPEWGWFPIQLHTLQGLDLANALIANQVWMGSLKCVANEDTTTGTVSISGSAPPEMLNALDEFCMSHANVPVRVSIPAHRPLSDESLQYLHDRHEMFLANCKTLCLHGAVLNAIAVLLGESASREILSRECLPPMRNLRDACNMIQQCSKEVVCLRVSFERQQFESALHWLASRVNGVFLVRLRGKNVDHVVALDANRRIIMDSVMASPMKLSVQSLRCCVGDPTVI